MKKIVLLLTLFCNIVFAQQDYFTDPRDGKSYKTVVIGYQTWMAENLNYNSENSKCYENKQANCDKYGRLYGWYNARKICPQGWHLPDFREWETLMNTVGGFKTAGKNLKAKSGWNDNGNGVDTYNFMALPGGIAGSDESFEFIGAIGNWWSESTRNDNAIYAYFLNIGYKDEKAGIETSIKGNLLSVRCLKEVRRW